MSDDQDEEQPHLKPGEPSMTGTGFAQLLAGEMANAVAASVPSHGSNAEDGPLDERETSIDVADIAERQRAQRLTVAEEELVRALQQLGLGYEYAVFAVTQAVPGSDAASPEAFEKVVEWVTSNPPSSQDVEYESTADSAPLAQHGQEHGDTKEVVLCGEGLPEDMQDTLVDVDDDANGDDDTAGTWEVEQEEFIEGAEGVDQPSTMESTALEDEEADAEAVAAAAEAAALHMVGEVAPEAGLPPEQPPGNAARLPPQLKDSSQQEKQADQAERSDSDAKEHDSYHQQVETKSQQLLSAREAIAKLVQAGLSRMEAEKRLRRAGGDGLAVLQDLVAEKRKTIARIRASRARRAGPKGNDRNKEERKQSRAHSPSVPSSPLPSTRSSPRSSPRSRAERRGRITNSQSPSSRKRYQFRRSLSARQISPRPPTSPRQLRRSASVRSPTRTQPQQQRQQHSPPFRRRKRVRKAPLPAEARGKAARSQHTPEAEHVTAPLRSPRAREVSGDEHGQRKQRMMRANAGTLPLDSRRSFRSPRRDGSLPGPIDLRSSVPSEPNPIPPESRNMASMLQKRRARAEAALAVLVDLDKADAAARASGVVDPARAKRIRELRRAVLRLRGMVDAYQREWSKTHTQGQSYEEEQDNSDESTDEASRPKCSGKTRTNVRNSYVFWMRLRSKKSSADPSMSTGPSLSSQFPTKRTHTISDSSSRSRSLSRTRRPRSSSRSPVTPSDEKSPTNAFLQSRSNRQLVDTVARAHAYNDNDPDPDCLSDN